MTDNTMRLSRLAARAIPAGLAPAPIGFARIGETSAIALSGEPQVDLNMVFVGPGRDGRGFLADGIVRGQAMDVPFAVFLAGDASLHRRAVEAAGLSLVGDSPLMLLREERQVVAKGTGDVSLAEHHTAIAAASRLQGAAFELPAPTMERLAVASRSLADPPLIYVAARDGVPMSSVTVTLHGDTAGIWTMATPAEHQRKGVGRALLTHGIALHRARGVRDFYLMATPAGQPLYESLGFETVALCEIWSNAKPETERV